MQCTELVSHVIYDSCALQNYAVIKARKSQLSNALTVMTCPPFAPLLEEVSKPQAAEKAVEAEKTEAAEAKTETAQSS